MYCHPIQGCTTKPGRRAKTAFFLGQQQKRNSNFEWDLILCPKYKLHAAFSQCELWRRELSVMPGLPPALFLSYRTLWFLFFLLNYIEMQYVRLWTCKKNKGGKTQPPAWPIMRICLCFTAGDDPILQSQCVPMHPPEVGPPSWIRHHVRHHHPQALQVRKLSRYSSRRENRECNLYVRCFFFSPSMNYSYGDVKLKAKPKNKHTPHPTWCLLSDSFIPFSVSIIQLPLKIACVLAHIHI